MVLATLALAAFAIGLSLAFQVSQKRRRAARFRGLVLKPNCLLTRYPIAFLSGPRTVFRLFDHWNDVPLYLREHGYDVYVIEPSGHHRDERAESVRTALAQLDSSCHLIADGSLEGDLEALAAMKLANVSSFTVVKSRERAESDREKRSLSVNDLKPLASAIEVFEVSPPASFSIAAGSERLKLVLLGAHNFLIKHRTGLVHPVETAEVSFGQAGFQMEERFLDLAISLAERDLIGSD